MMERRGGGRIVFISSLGSSRFVPFYTMVGIAKGVVETLTRYLAAELAPRRISVNCVKPGTVMTDRWNHFPGGADDFLVEIKKKTPMQRLATPENVAKLVFFLCSEGAEMIVGQTITIDDGFTLTV